MDSGILWDFLTAHAAAVEEVMEQMFNQEEIFARIRQEDRQEGRQEGFAKGQEKTMVSNLQQLMHSMGLTPEQAMTALGIVGGDREKYGKLLGAAH